MYQNISLATWNKSWSSNSWYSRIKLLELTEQDWWFPSQFVTYRVVQKIIVAAIAFWARMTQHFFQTAANDMKHHSFLYTFPPYLSIGLTQTTSFFFDDVPAKCFYSETELLCLYLVFSKGDQMLSFLHANSPLMVHCGSFRPCVALRWVRP